MYKKVSKEIVLILLMAAYLIVPSSVVQLSHAQPNQDMKDILDLHNRERAAVGFPRLTWSDSLAADAQSWANHLATLGIVCGPQGCKPIPPHGTNNENIALGPVFPADLGRTSPQRGGTDFLVCRYSPGGNVGIQAPSNLPNYSVTK